MSPRDLTRSPWNCGKNKFFLSSTYLRMFHVLDLEENSRFVCLLCFYSISGEGLVHVLKSNYLNFAVSVDLPNLKKSTRFCTFFIFKKAVFPFS